MEGLNWRARIGLIVNSGQLITEPRFSQAAPLGVTFHATRMLNRGGGIEHLLEMEKQAMRGVEELSTARVSALAYCCTVSGAIRGIEGDQEFCREVERDWGIPATSTMLAVVEAMQHLGIRRVVVTSPYVDSHHDPERDYMAQAGIEAVAMRGMGLTTGKEFTAVPPEEIYRFSLEAWDDQADGMFISCMNFDGMAAAQALEEAIGKPVITSHSATLWRALALAGIDDPITGCGRLLTLPRAGVPAGAQ